MTLEIGLAAATAGFLLLFWFTPLGIPTLKRLGHGRTQPDLAFGFAVGPFYELMALYGAQGVSHWRRMLWLDMIFPAVYGVLFALLMQRWADWVHASPTWRAAGIAFPLLAGGSDYIENLLLFRVLDALPKRRPGTVAIASLFTQAKHIFSVLTLLLPVIFWICSFAPSILHRVGL